jgi:hypothetical protein
MGGNSAISWLIGVFIFSFVMLTARRLCRANRTRANQSWLARVGQRLRSSEWRRYGAILVAGRPADVLVLAGITYLINPDLCGLRVWAAVSLATNPQPS